MTMFFLLLFITMISFPLVSNAYSLISSSDPGGVLKGSPFYYAANDEIRMEYVSGTVKQVDLTFDGTITKSFTAPSSDYYAASGFTCVGTYDVTLKDSSSSVLATYSIRVDDGDLSVPKCDSDSGADPGAGDGESSCDSCGAFSCPGWDEHMGKMDEILSAIPPAPNWQEVANTFRDTITPKVKSDLQEVLGSVDAPPSPPAPPAIPYLGDDLDDGGLTAPTGESAPGLDDSTFSTSDIKNEAPVIEEREDASGGFIINNPLDGLPSQEEFIQNAPNEGSVDLPGNPTELENTAPTPTEEINTAPAPTEPENMAPTPDEGMNTAPTPEDSGATAPIPSESGTAPLPNESGTAPLPGDDGSTAPLPIG